MKLLSFCIATRNQPNELEKLLATLLRQSRVDDIEIIIVDDSDNVASEKIVRRFSSLIGIEYFHGDKNGLDSGILKLTRRATGKFIWWFGDDYLQDNAIEKVLGVLEANPSIDFVYLNSISEKNKEISIDIVNDQLINDANKMLLMFRDNLGFISATILKRSKIEGVLEYSKKYIGKAFLNLFLVLYNISVGKSFYYLGRPVFIAREKSPQKKLWYDPFEVFGINYTNILRDKIYRHKFDRKVIRKAIRVILTNIAKTFFVHKAMGYRYGLSPNIMNILKYIHTNWTYIHAYYIIPVYIIPRVIAKNIYLLKKLFLKGSK